MNGSKFLITGGQPLNGEIKLAGAKNAATKMMIASLLTDQKCVLENFPHIGDTEIVADLCQQVGAKIEYGDSSIKIHTPVITNHRVQSLSRKNRIPILALGPLLARVGEAEVPVLGGDKIGPRPVNLHIEALTALGAEIKTTATSYQATAKDGLRGTKIALNFPSVGATENVLLSAVLAKGRTIIYNAATEPEVIDLIKMLQKMGAIIELGANRTIYIDGVEKLRGVTHRILPDRNEAVSFACLAVATDGRILVREARQDDLITFLNALRKIGGDYDVVKEGIVFYRAKNLEGVEIETDCHPGFMTDWQQPFAVLLTQAKGVSILHETIYEDRLGYINDLNFMGASIKVLTKCLGDLNCRFNSQGHYHSAVIHGPTPLKAINTSVRDLRSGMLNITSALIAEGESEISGIEEIDRGYENIDERLRGLGAQIKRVCSQEKLV
ncbi:MAG: UDP-N-acetylglucosamine 1-carboxyvinyltransferase [Patescibacteria group bacterium]